MQSSVTPRCAMSKASRMRRSSTSCWSRSSPRAGPRPPTTPRRLKGERPANPTPVARLPCHMTLPAARASRSSSSRRRERRATRTGCQRIPCRALSGSRTSSTSRPCTPSTAIAASFTASSRSRCTASARTSSWTPYCASSAPRRAAPCAAWVECACAARLGRVDLRDTAQRLNP